MKRIILVLLVITLSVLVTGCGKTKDNKVKKIDLQDNESIIDSEVETVRVFINEIEYTLKLEDNETANSFIKLLPKELKMSELNGNEKYIYLDSSLPTNHVNPKHISAGDVMLYGDNCLVIFYKSFDTSYSYTKIGHIDNLSDLGDDTITVKFMY